LRTQSSRPAFYNDIATAEKRYFFNRPSNHTNGYSESISTLVWNNSFSN